MTPPMSMAPPPPLAPVRLAGVHLGVGTQVQPVNQLVIRLSGS